MVLFSMWSCAKYLTTLTYEFCHIPTRCKCVLEKSQTNGLYKFIIIWMYRLKCTIVNFVGDVRWNTSQTRLWVARWLVVLVLTFISICSVVLLNYSFLSVCRLVLVATGFCLVVDVSMASIHSGFLIDAQRASLSLLPRQVMFLNPLLVCVINFIFLLSN
jgi:hypothetical protein